MEVNTMSMMNNDREFVSMIHQSNTDGDRFVAIYKPMSDEERSALLKQWWEKKENRWATRFEAPDILDRFSLDESCFPNKWFASMRECELNSVCSY